MLQELSFSATSSLEYFNKPGKRAVISLLHFGRKHATGKLVKLKVIGNTLTALALPGTRLVGTDAFCLIGFNLTFHRNLS